MNKTDFQALEASAVKDGIQKYVVGACIVHEGKVLLLKRSLKEEFLPGLIELPSGKVEDGETLASALPREVLEETNLTVKTIDTYLDSFDYTSHSGKKARQYNFTVTVEDIAPLTLNDDEHSEYFWVDPQLHDFSHFTVSENTLEIIGKIK